jgi:hypothetical protein
MESRWRTLMAARLGAYLRREVFRKVRNHEIVYRHEPSDTARPTAVEVKLLLSEKSMWRYSGIKARHHPWATTGRGGVP